MLKGTAEKGNTMNQFIERLTMSEEAYTASVRRYDDFVVRLQTCAKQTAEALIDLVTIVSEAQQELSPREFARFCRETKLPEGSKFRKWKKIGGKVARFRAVIERLPCNWTTLYMLAQLTDEAFDRVQQDPRFGPAMTAEDLKEIDSSRKVREFKPMVKLAVDLDTLTEDECEALKDALKDLRDRFKINFKMLRGKSAADRAAIAEAEARWKQTMAELEAEPVGAV